MKYFVNEQARGFPVWFNFVLLVIFSEFHLLHFDFQDCYSEKLKNHDSKCSFLDGKKKIKW